MIGLYRSLNERQSLKRNMTPAEIKAATNNPDVDWGYVDCGPRSIASTLWRRINLWVRIVGREWHDGRLGPIVSWRVVAGIYPWRGPVKAFGVVSDRRGDA